MHKPPHSCPGPAGTRLSWSWCCYAFALWSLGLMWSELRGMLQTRRSFKGMLLLLLSGFGEGALVLHGWTDDFPQLVDVVDLLCACGSTWLHSALGNFGREWIWPVTLHNHVQSCQRRMGQLGVMGTTHRNHVHQPCTSSPQNKNTCMRVYFCRRWEGLGQCFAEGILYSSVCSLCLLWPFLRSPAV